MPSNLIEDALYDGLDKYNRLLKVTRTDLSYNMNKIQRSAWNIAVEAGVNPHNGDGDSTLDTSKIPNFSTIESIYNDKLNAYMADFQDEVSFKQKLNDLPEGIVRDVVVAGFGNVMDEPFTMVKRAMKDIEPDVLQEVENVVGTEGVNIMKNVNSYVDGIMDFGSEIVNGDIGSIIGDMDSMIDYTVNFTENFDMDKIQSVMDNMDSFISDFSLDSVTDSLGSISFESIVDGIGEWGGNVLSKAMTGIMDNLYSIIDDLTGGMLTKINNIVDSVMNGINSLLGIASGFGEEEDSWGDSGAEGTRGGEVAPPEYY